ncbi:MAG: hypothetical protein K9G57_00690 [Ignavibacteriales bacterium]|nr:hypothetical protein [Ignavibacteriales bacterium]
MNVRAKIAGDLIVINKYIVEIENSKKEISVLSSHEVELEGKKLTVNLSKLSDYYYLLKIENKIFEIIVAKTGEDNYTLNIEGRIFEIGVKTRLKDIAEEYLKNKQKETRQDELKAPMPGLIINLKKNIGDGVVLGESLIVLEAMKMENDLKSPASGIIKEILVKKGEAVEKNQRLLVIE